MEVLVADTFSESKLREFSFKIDWEKGKADKTCKENSLTRKVHKERLLLYKESKCTFGTYNIPQIHKIRRGPKSEGYAFANFGYSSGTEGESRFKKTV